MPHSTLRRENKCRHGACPCALDVVGDENAVPGGPDRRQEGWRDGVEVERGELLDRLGSEAAQKRFLTAGQVPEKRSQTKLSVQVGHNLKDAVINKGLMYIPRNRAVDVRR